MNPEEEEPMSFRNREPTPIEAIPISIQSARDGQIQPRAGEEEDHDVEQNDSNWVKPRDAEVSFHPIEEDVKEDTDQKKYFTEEAKFITNRFETVNDDNPIEQSKVSGLANETFRNTTLMNLVPGHTTRKDPEKPQVPKNENIPSRINLERRKYIIGVCLGLVIVILAVTLPLVLIHDSSESITFMDSLNDPNQPLLIRNWRAGAQETYYVSMDTVMEAGSADSPGRQTGSQKYIFSVTTLSVNPEEILINAYMIPVTGYFDLDQSKINNIDNITSESAIQDQNILVWCSILPTGLMKSCQKPLYLDRSNYELIVSFIDQYSPRLEKKYYNNPERRRRLLAEQTEPAKGFEDITENREYTYEVDQNKGQVTLQNDYQNDNFTISDEKTSDKSTMAAKTAAQVDGTTGQVTKADLTGSFNCEADQTRGKGLIEVFKTSFNTSMELKTYKESANEVMISFLNRMHDVIDFQEILNPMTNRTALDEKLSEEEQEPNSDWGDDMENQEEEEDEEEEEEEVEDEDEGSTDTGGRLRVLSTGRRLVMSMDEPIFETTAIGLPVNARIKMRCYDDDQCEVAIKGKLLFITIKLIEETFPFKAASIAKAYRFIKLKIVDSITKVGKLVTSIVNTLESTANKANAELELFGETIFHPLTSASSKFKNIIDTLNRKIVEMNSFVPEITSLLEERFMEALFILEQRFASKVFDIDFNVAEINEIYEVLTHACESGKLSTEALNEALTYLDAVNEKFVNYVEEKNKNFLNIKNSFSTFADQVLEKIAQVPFQSEILAKFPEAQTLKTVSTIFKQFIDPIINKQMGSMNNFFDNFIIRYGAQFESLQKNLTRLTDSTKTALQNLCPAQDIGSIDHDFVEEIKEILDLKLIDSLLYDQSEIYDVDFAEFEETISLILIDGIENFFSGLKALLSNGADFFNAVYKDIKNDVDETVRLLTGQKFPTFLSKIKAIGTDSYSKLRSDFDSTLSSLTGLTAPDYFPSADDVNADKKALNLVNAVKDTVKTFNDFKTIINTFDKVKNFNLGSLNPLASVSNTVTNSITDIKSAYTGAVDVIKTMAQQFNMDFTPPQLNFDTFKSLLADLPGQFKNQFIQTLKTELINKALDTGYLMNLLSFESGLTTKLGSLIPPITQVLYDNRLDFTKATPDIRIPTPIGPLCFKAEFHLAVGARIEYGFDLGSGGLFFTAMPYGLAGAGVKAFMNWGILEVGAFADGIFFDGRFPITMTFSFIQKLELRSKGELILYPFAIELGAYFRIITIDVHFCCRISIELSDPIIIAKLRFATDPIRYTLFDIALALK